MSLKTAAKRKTNPADKIPSKVIVVTGASGGHIFPALAFLEKLKDKYGAIDALLVLPRPFYKVDDIVGPKPKGLAGDSVVSNIDNLGYRVKYLPVSAIRLSFSFSNLAAIFNFFKATLQSIALLIRFAPDIVVAFGSIICLPLVFFAWLFRIRTMLHEQNVIPGRANRFLSKIADRIAVSFSETRDYFKVSVNKLVVTGNPLRASLRQIDKAEALSFFGLSAEKFTILVTGGSQGSHKINFCFQQAFSGLSGKEALQIIHLAGIKDYDLLKEAYKDFTGNVKLFDFFQDMQYAYSAADLVVTRAGATTISELILFRLPAIIIPYPFAYQHQLANARILEKSHSGVIIEDRLLDADTLKNALELLLGDRGQLANMRLGYQSLFSPQAADRLLECALSLN